jgi:hypothetical protein
VLAEAKRRDAIPYDIPDVLAEAKRRDAIPYDIPDVELGHHGPECSFDAFVDRYELSDPALRALAVIVRGADTDDCGITPESAGLYAAATGFQANSHDDFDNMAKQFPMYDAFYTYCQQQVKTAPQPRAWSGQRTSDALPNGAGSRSAPSRPGRSPIRSSRPAR